MYPNSAHENVMRRAAEVTPSMRYDGKENFKEWQNRARAKLAELLGMDKFVSCDLNVQIEYDRMEENFREIRFTFESEPGYHAPCHLLIPKNATGKLPVMIGLQGHSKGQHVSLGRTRFEGETITEGSRIRAFAVQSVQQGYAAVTLEMRGMGECGGDENGPRCGVHTLANLTVGRTTIGERVWDVSHLIDVLTTTFAEYIDESKIYCMGNSGGGTATFYAGCMEERLAAVMPSCSYSDYDDSIIAMAHCTCNFIPHIREYFNMGDLSGLIAPRKFVPVAGEWDRIFPLPGVKGQFEETKRIFAAAGVPDNCELIVGTLPKEYENDPYEGHRFYPEQAWPIFHKMVD
ncbi:MAG: acetylxylan esterase [Clostridia bacterium]|nr:acetylxylan esterase [Clostridia bacterium]